MAAMPSNCPGWLKINSSAFLGALEQGFSFLIARLMIPKFTLINSKINDAISRRSETLFIQV
jgi:hypothetical protein